MWALLSPSTEQNGMGKVCCLVGDLFNIATTGCARCVKWQVEQDGPGQGINRFVMEASFWLAKLGRKTSSGSCEEAPRALVLKEFLPTCCKIIQLLLWMKTFNLYRMQSWEPSQLRGFSLPSHEVLLESQSFNFC